MMKKVILQLTNMGYLFNIFLSLIIISSSYAQVEPIPFYITEDTDLGEACVNISNNNILCFVKVFNTSPRPTIASFMKYDDYLKPIDSFTVDNSNGDEIYLTEVIKIDNDNIWFFGYGSNTMNNTNTKFISLILIDENLNVKKQKKIELDYAFQHLNLTSLLNNDGNIVLFNENNSPYSYTFYELGLDGNLLNQQQYFGSIHLQTAWQKSDSTYALVHKYSVSEVFINADTSYLLYTNDYLGEDTSYAKLSRANFKHKTLKLNDNKYLTGGQVSKNPPFFDDSTYLSEEFIDLFAFDNELNFHSIFSYNKRASSNVTFSGDELVNEVPNYLYLTGMQDVNHSNYGGLSSIIEVFQIDTVGNMNWHNSIQVDDAKLNINTCLATKDTGVIVFIRYAEYSQTNLDIYAIKFDKYGNQVEISDNSVLGIETISTLNKFSLFPNPSQGIINIQLALPRTKEVDISVINLEGKVIFEEKFILQNGLLKENLDLSQKSSGIYFVKIASDKETYTKKVMLKD